jgi:hypothetical protein
MPQPLFKKLSPLASRQPKTDRLFLASLVKDQATRSDLAFGDDIPRAHAILIGWADFERTGRLADLNETQLQGDFLRDVFGDALGYKRPAENEPLWHLEQHYNIGGSTPDAVLGHFKQDEPRSPIAVVELKGPEVHLDRQRFAGRTAVDQCWDYLIDLPPNCRWGIVSNMISFRLYERNSTKRVYEHFTLQSLRDINVFREFYAIFHREGLIEGKSGQLPRVDTLISSTQNRQREVSDKLYDSYSSNRTELIRYLHFELGHPVDKSIEMAQRLFDRIMFIAFCEDRHLLPSQTIPKAYTVAGFQAARNPRWKSFKDLFGFINAGDDRYDIPKYNGGLFQPHDVDDLELPDDPWTTFFRTISSYDFADEVNLDVLGHLFERSITELEKAKLGGLFGDQEKAERFATMPQSVKRKQLGIYYTPPELTSRIVQYTVEELIEERFADLAVKFGIKREDALRNILPDDEAFWRGCLDILRNLKIVDPACGSGAFLFQAYNVLEARYFEAIGHLEQYTDGPGSVPIFGSEKMGTDPVAHSLPYDELADQIPSFILNDNLYGVDLSPEAVEITQLALWIRSATRGQTLATLSRNIVHGNSLVHDPQKHPAGFDWRERFPEVFAPGSVPIFGSEKMGTDPLTSGREPGFDCVIGNPPWERIKLQEREFFSLPAPEIATATNAATRRKLVAKLESDDPALYERYQQALAAADSLLSYCRTSNAYPLTGKGDINTYAVFAELAYNIVAPHGRVGLLTPSGIASDKTTMDFFAAIAESNRLIRLYDFENRTRHFFPEVDNRFKFCILNFGGSSVEHESADFVFFAHTVDDLDDRDRHIALSSNDIRLLNPNTRTCPIFRTKRDAEITKAIYRRVPILIDHHRSGPTGNPWGVTFLRMFDQTNDAELFHEPDALKKDGYKLKGNRWVKGKQKFLPLYEAKMVQAFDHRAANVLTEKSNWMRQGQKENPSTVEYQNPEYLALPRFWVSMSEVNLTDWGSLGFKDITSPTNQRTMIGACGPLAGYTNHFVLIRSEKDTRAQLCLGANLNAFLMPSHTTMWLDRRSAVLP